MRIANSIVNSLVSMLSILLIVAVLEIGLRIYAFVDSQQTIDDAFANPPRLEVNQPAALAHIIRPSKNPKIIYEGRPNIQVTYIDQLTKLNQSGFRDKDYAVVKPQRTFRIVGIGDSFMFGYGVVQGTDYLSRFEQRLNTEFPDRRWEIVNTAFPGYNTVMEIETLKEKGLQYQPDLVVIEFVGNDLSLPNFIRKDPSPDDLGISFLYRLVATRLQSEKNKLEQPGQPAIVTWLQQHNIVHAIWDPMSAGFLSNPDEVPEQYRQMVGWQAFTGALRELRKLSELHGFRVLMLSLAPSNSQTKLSALKQARKEGFEVLDIGEYLSAYMKQQGWTRYLGSLLSLSIEGRPSFTIGSRHRGGQTI